MRDELSKNEILGWDVHNWSHAFRYWQSVLPKDKKLTCLEIGANKGGLSIWLASLGHDVVCSDLDPTSNDVKAYHLSLNLKGKIDYHNFDAVQIPYQNKFDIIILKSVLGGIGRSGQEERIQKSIQEIYKALKPGGMFLFAENLKASKFHTFFRRNFVKWAKDWNYLKKLQMAEYLNDFQEKKLYTSGFLGVFGFNEKSKAFLGKLDSAIFNNLPSGYHYIIYGHATK